MVWEGLIFCDCGTPWTFLLPFFVVCDCGTPLTFLVPFLNQFYLRKSSLSILQLKYMFGPHRDPLKQENKKTTNMTKMGAITGILNQAPTFRNILNRSHI